MYPPVECQGENAIGHQLALVALVALHPAQRLSAPLPRFPVEACGVDTLDAPFLNEGADADLFSTAWQEIGVKPGFACRPRRPEPPFLLRRWI
jgi:hypothetical protein